jgi:myo-inositol 2-dehydrogenase/D-chiro-inositol 1-dehydrogenase
MTERPTARHGARESLAVPQEADLRPPLGVGIVGAGPVTQAIHLPTLAKLSDRFRVVHVMDVSPTLAERVASQAGATWSSTLEDLLADPEVDVVAICSPPEYHSSQVIAAAHSNSVAIMCEKPLALDLGEVDDAIAASGDAGVPLLVGAMHSFDPAWLAAREAWTESGHRAHTIRSSIVLPPNARFEDLATEVVGRAPARADSAGDVASTPRGDQIRDLVLGVAVHDLPLIRTFLAEEPAQILAASFEPPFGYLIVLQVGTITIELRAAFTETWQPDWRLEVFADDAVMTVRFPPSYVQAGSSTAEIATRQGTRVLGPWSANGYEEEWRALADLAAGAAPAQSLASIRDDIAFALGIADDAAALVEAPGLAAAL